MTVWGLVRPGDVLVSDPCADPALGKQVVLVVVCDDESVLGLQVNQPTDVDALDHFPTMAGLFAAPGKVFAGGPAGREGAVVLAALTATSPGFQGWRPIADQIGFLDPNVPARTLHTQVHQLRVFAGYCMWTPQQLASEILRGVWMPPTHQPGYILDHDPATMWRRIVAHGPARHRPKLSWTPDPEQN